MSVNDALLTEEGKIRKLICNKITKELHLGKIKRPNLLWLFRGLLSLRLLLFTSFWESCLCWQKKGFCGSVFETQVGEKILIKKNQNKKNEKKPFLYSLSLARSYYKERFFAFQTMPWWVMLSRQMLLWTSLNVS